MIDKMDFMRQNVTEKRPIFRGAKTHMNTLLNAIYNFIFQYSLIEVPKRKKKVYDTPNLHSHAIAQYKYWGYLCGKK